MQRCAGSGGRERGGRELSEREREALKQQLMGAMEEGMRVGVVDMDGRGVRVRRGQRGGGGWSLHCHGCHEGRGRRGLGVRDTRVTIEAQHINTER